MKKYRTALLTRMETSRYKTIVIKQQFMNNLCYLYIVHHLYKKIYCNDKNAGY